MVSKEEYRVYKCVRCVHEQCRVTHVKLPNLMYLIMLCYSMLGILHSKGGDHEDKQWMAWGATGRG